MRKYRVQRMTNSNYSDYLSGRPAWGVEEAIIEAESPEEAARAFEKEGYTVNGYVGDVEKEEKEREEWRKEREKEEKREEERKERKAQREREKAEELGITIEELRKRQRRRGNITRVKREIAKLEEELARKKGYLARLEREREEEN